MLRSQVVSAGFFFFFLRGPATSTNSREIVAHGLYAATHGYRRPPFGGWGTSATVPLRGDPGGGIRPGNLRMSANSHRIPLHRAEKGVDGSRRSPTLITRGAGHLALSTRPGYALRADWGWLASVEGSARPAGGTCTSAHVTAVAGGRGP